MFLIQMASSQLFKKKLPTSFFKTNQTKSKGLDNT